MAKRNNKGKSKATSKETTDEEVKKMLENAEINAMLSQKGEAYWQQQLRSHGKGSQKTGSKQGKKAKSKT